MPTSIRSPRTPLVTALSLLVLAACPVNGSTDPVTTTDTTGEASSTTGTPNTSDVTTSGTGTDAGTAADTGSGSAATTGTTTAATATDGDSSGEGACDPAECEPCAEGCTPQQECVDGEVVCECVDCPDEVACDEDPPVFPEFDETCAAIEDCTIVFHQLDCCGSQAAWGVNADASKPFAEAEAVCTMQYPVCECPAQPTVADDGNTAADPALIQVDCVEGLCKTYVP